MKNIKTLKTSAQNYIATHPSLAKASATLGLMAMAIGNPAMADFNPSNAITKMVGYVTAIISGVGIIYAIVAVFNWVSAIKQEDSERQSKAIVNVFIAGLLIAIGPIAAVIINALGGSAGSYGLGS